MSKYEGTAWGSPFVFAIVCGRNGALCSGKRYNFFQIGNQLTRVGNRFIIHLQSHAVLLIVDRIDNDLTICMKLSVLALELLPDWQNAGNIGGYSIVKVSETAS